MSRVYDCHKTHGSIPCPRFLALTLCRILDRITAGAWDYSA